jgi:hypothetical protein
VRFMLPWPVLIAITSITKNAATAIATLAFVGLNRYFSRAFS